MHGLAVTTAEGCQCSGTTSINTVALFQERIAKSFGSQCGFCTPGMVMSMYTLLRNNPQPTAKQIENGFQGEHRKRWGKSISYFRKHSNLFEQHIEDVLQSKDNNLFNFMYK